MEPNIYHLHNHLYHDNPDSSSFSYLPNPNPNPNPHPNLPSVSIGDGGVLRPPGVNHYPQYPVYSHTTIPTAATAPSDPVSESCYYHGITGGGSLYQQYAPQPDSFSYGIMNQVVTAKTFADLETKKWKVIQGGASANSVRVCTICNVVCNSDKVFASHVAGEKHALKAIGVSPGALKSKLPAHLKALHSTNKRMHLTPNTAAMKTANGLVTFVPSSYCEVCKIDCNSQEVLNSHKMGKKHMKNMQKLQASITPKPASAPLRNPVQKDASVVAEQPKAPPSSYCDVCKIDCNSQEVLNSHKMGKKHIKNMQKLQASITPKPESAPLSNPVQKDDSVVAKKSKAPPTKEDLEIKKQKVLNGGAVVDRVRVCGICNVVCNSETVFNSHIAGQKHLAEVNKQ